MFKWLQMQQRYERRLWRIPALYKTTLLLLCPTLQYFINLIFWRKVDVLAPSGFVHVFPNIANYWENTLTSRSPVPQMRHKVKLRINKEMSDPEQSRNTGNVAGSNHQS